MAKQSQQNFYDEITAQALKEISFDRAYKQGKIAGWQKNEDIYYNVKEKSKDSRSNVNLARGQEFVHTLLSKIKTSSKFKFGKNKESQLQRVNRLNALATQDAKNDHWNIKDFVGKKQSIIYGRAVYSYYADSIDKNYMPHNENVDVYDFLIDPAAGGIDIEVGRNMGRFGVVLSRQNLELMKNDELYIKKGINTLLSGSGNSTENTQETNNTDNRTTDQNTRKDKQIDDPDKFIFWEWFTTYKGERYYMLLNEVGSTAIRIEKLVNMFSPTEMYKLGAWPFWTWAAYVDLTEFWSAAPMDYVRDILLAQDVTINQMLDNAEAINKPQKAVQVGSIENMAEVKYRKDGIVRVKKNVNIDSAIKLLSVPSINTPMEVFNALETILQKSSGVTNGDKGVADENGRLGIYEGNQENAADRYGLLYDSYTIGLERFARLYEIGVRDNLTKKKAVEMIGPNGIETEMISRKDIYKKGDDFSVSIEATNADKMLSNSEQRAKLEFLNAELGNPIQNAKKAYEIKASIVGFDPDTIKELLDTKDYGNSELMAECARDIESLLDGDTIKPNSNANNAYKQKMVDWLTDHEEDINQKTFLLFTAYIDLLDPIIMKNEIRKTNQTAIKEMSDPMIGGNLGTGITSNPPIQ